MSLIAIVIVSEVWPRFPNHNQYQTHMSLILVMIGDIVIVIVRSPDLEKW